MSKETFKIFAKSHPELIKHVSSNKTTWQKLYEMYEIYGEDDPVWNEYFTKKTEIQETTTLKDVVDTVKKMDLNTIQKGINNIQKTIGLLQDIGLTENNKQEQQQQQQPYEPRPIYRYFED